MATCVPGGAGANPKKITPAEKAMELWSDRMEVGLHLAFGLWAGGKPGSGRIQLAVKKACGTISSLQAQTLD
jgi:hypothetical protein